MVNSMTNRKPVKIHESNTFFDNLRRSENQYSPRPNLEYNPKLKKYQSENLNESYKSKKSTVQIDEVTIKDYYLLFHVV